MTSGQLPFNRVAAPQFHYAEEHHQQYLAKTPNGCCGIAGWEGGSYVLQWLSADPEVCISAEYVSTAHADAMVRPLFNMMSIVFWRAFPLWPLRRKFLITVDATQ